MTRLSAPIFAFGDAPTLALVDSYTRPPRTEGMLAMTGPSVRADPGCLPVRGDLAHIKLAGLYFVPHYAAPMPRTLAAGAVLRSAGRADAETVTELAAGATFNVLDISGNWAWGQLGEDGPVGYVALGELESAS